MAIVKFVSPIAQVAETHMETFKSLQTNLKYHIRVVLGDIKRLKERSRDMLRKYVKVRCLAVGGLEAECLLDDMTIVILMRIVISRTYEVRTM